jgi:hypothetical protein
MSSTTAEKAEQQQQQAQPQEKAKPKVLLPAAWVPLPKEYENLIAATLSDASSAHPLLPK